MKIGMISLGCSKNLVDSEMILGLMNKAECEFVNDPKEADLIIINTCGFIETAKQEAIDVILEMIDYRQYGAKVVVTGCLVERYLADLKKELPEVDLFIPIREYSHFGELISPLLNKRLAEKLHHEERVLTTPKHFAYVKIAEGCDNCCHYCAIPLIRGRFRSRLQADIINEVQQLVKKGVKEIVLISQDTTRYGTDLQDGTTISSLLTELAKIKDLQMLRFLYLYPGEITEDLIETVKNNPVIAPYFDVPIQHASDTVLKAMNRRDNVAGLRKTFNRIKALIPQAILRTTVIVGYPGETEEQFQELVSFVKEIRFDRLGCFTYSKEEDTVAFSLPYQIAPEIQTARYEEIMAVQEQISYERGMSFVNTKQKVIIEDFDEEGKMYIGRSYAFAPDDIDGCIFVDTEKELIIGEIYECEINNADLYNLYAII